MPHFARCARVVHTFCPVTIHSSPSRTARVESPATSEPAPGSEKSWHQISSSVTSATSTAMGPPEANDRALAGYWPVTSARLVTAPVTDTRRRVSPTRHNGCDDRPLDGACRRDAPGRHHHARRGLLVLPQLAVGRCAARSAARADLPRHPLRE